MSNQIDGCSGALPMQPAATAGISKRLPQPLHWKTGTNSLVLMNELR
jgi:hypothetical protein